MLVELMEPTSTAGGNSIFVTKDVRKAVATGTLNGASRTPNAFYFTIPSLNAPMRSGRHKTVKILEVEPRELWDAQNNVFLTRGLRNFTAFLRFHVFSKVSYYYYWVYSSPF